nr:hypothetical protein LKV13_04335 [Borrelia sp. BU AG58]
MGNRKARVAIMKAYFANGEVRIVRREAEVAKLKVEKRGKSLGWN